MFASRNHARFLPRLNPAESRSQSGSPRSQPLSFTHSNPRRAQSPISLPALSLRAGSFSPTPPLRPCRASDPSRNRTAEVRSTAATSATACLAAQGGREHASGPRNARRRHEDPIRVRALPVVIADGVLAPRPGRRGSCRPRPPFSASSPGLSSSTCALTLSSGLSALPHPDRSPRTYPGRRR